MAARAPGPVRFDHAQARLAEALAQLGPAARRAALGFDLEQESGLALDQLGEPLQAFALVAGAGLGAHAAHEMLETVMMEVHQQAPLSTLLREAGGAARHLHGPVGPFGRNQRPVARRALPRHLHRSSRGGQCATCASTAARRLQYNEAPAPPHPQPA